MPYKSDAQRKKFHVLEAEGKISHETVHEWDEESRGMRLSKKKRKDKARGKGMQGSETGW